MSESSQFKRGLPALIVGTLAVLLAAYGYWILPSQLPDKYRSELQRLGDEYKEVADGQSLTRGRKLVQHAADLNIVYRRLLSLEDGSADRHWQWAEFQLQHVSLLSDCLSDAAASESDETRQRMQEQVAKFRSEAYQSMEQLAVVPSEKQPPAVLWLADQLFTNGPLIQNQIQPRVASLRQILGLPDLSETETQADPLTDRSDESESREATSSDEQGPAAELPTVTLTRSQREQAALRLIQFTYEQAWWQTEKPTVLQANRDAIDLAWDLFQEFAPDAIEQSILTGNPPSDDDQNTAVDDQLPLSSENASQWMAIGYLLAAQHTEACRQVSFTNRPLLVEPPEEDLPTILAQLQRLCLEGSWKKLLEDMAWYQSPISGIGKLTEVEQRLLQQRLAATILRLSVSPLAKSDKGLARQFASGLVPAVQLDPSSPELSSLLWMAALQTAGLAEQGVPSLPETVYQRLMQSDDTGELASIVTVLAAALRDDFATAAEQQRLLAQAGGAASRVIPQMAWWYLQRDTEYLDAWNGVLTEHVQLTENDGLGWLALGLLQLKQDDYKSAPLSLERAQELLPEAEVVTDLMKQAESRVDLTQDEQDE